MKRTIAKIAFAVILFAPLGFGAVAQAVVNPVWDITGTYSLPFVCTSGCAGTYTHTLNVTTMDFGTGDFSGNGYYNAIPAYTWDITGTVTGFDISFHIVYTGLNPGYTVDGVGTIAADGTMSGTATSGTGQTFTWTLGGGKAKIVNPSVPDWGQQLSASACGKRLGSPVINVTEKVTNDVDSGLVGNWAIDNYNRHIQVWETNSSTLGNTYCALVTYEGMFNASSGATGPGGTGLIGADVSGPFKGGYRATFTGTMSDSPLSTRGNIGTFDYGCDIGGTCIPGRVNWLTQYFNSYNSFDQVWWGWFYYGGTHGNWLNSIDGNYGNIL